MNSCSEMEYRILKLDEPSYSRPFSLNLTSVPIPPCPRTTRRPIVFSTHTHTKSSEPIVYSRIVLSEFWETLTRTRTPSFSPILDIQNRHVSPNPPRPRLQGQSLYPLSDPHFLEKVFSRLDWISFSYRTH